MKYKYSRKQLVKMYSKSLIEVKRSHILDDLLAPAKKKPKKIENIEYSDLACRTADDILSLVDKLNEVIDVINSK